VFTDKFHKLEYTHTRAHIYASVVKNIISYKESNELMDLNAAEIGIISRY